MEHAYEVQCSLGISFDFRTFSVFFATSHQNYSWVSNVKFFGKVRVEFDLEKMPTRRVFREEKFFGFILDPL